MVENSPFPTLIEEAKTGTLSVRLDPQGFIAMDKACDDLILVFEDAQLSARAIANRERWGLGEDHPQLVSAMQLVDLFRKKADGGPNSAVEVLNEYIAATEELRALFKAVCDRFVATDAEFARQMRELEV